MTYRRDRNVRNVYEERFPDRGPYPRGSPAMDRRVPFGRQDDYNHGAGYEGGPRFYQDGGDPHNYHGDEQRGYHGDVHHFPVERRGAPPSRREDYPYRGAREDQQPSRAMEFGSRAPPTSHGLRNYPTPRSMPENDEHLMQSMFTADRGKPGPAPPFRERSPCRREGVRSPHSRSGSSVSSRGYSPDRAKAGSIPLQQNKIPGLSREASPQSGVSVKEENHSLLEKEEHISAILEDSLKQAEPLDRQRAATIAAKAKELEEIFHKDCEVFGMVVNMLVGKDPNLETQLQVPLRESLGEIRERCLNELKCFIADLDRRSWPPETPACDSGSMATGH